MSILAEAHAEIRLAFDDREPGFLSAQQISDASKRLDVQADEDEVKLKGTFRGLTHESLYYDFISDDEGVISGSVSGALSDAELDMLDGLINEYCEAHLLRTTVKRPGRDSTVKYTLLKLYKAPDDLESLS
jgi:hypothetical protein